MMMMMIIIIIIITVNVLYYLCAGTTTTSPVTETVQEHTGNSQIRTTNGVISWSLSPRQAASSGFSWRNGLQYGA